MIEYESIMDLVFDSLKKFFYPQEWISLDLDFSKSEIFTMLLVDKHGEIIMSQVADYINVSMSTANGIVERLVKSGHLNRDRSDTDRRIVLIRLTDKGKKLVEQLKNIIFEYVQLIYESLDDEERKLIFKVFNKVVEILNKKYLKPQEDPSKNQLKKITIE
jgi:DNA-binding MarR family transcriptional regulator